MGKFDVNIDRFISCDFVPVLADCREAAAEAVGHLNFGIFAALAEDWERGHSKGKLQTDENSENFKFNEIQVNSEIQVSIGQSSPLFDDVLTGFFRFSTCPSAQCPGGRDVWALEK